MKFAVVEFPEEQRVAIVPSSWVLQSEGLCMWPPDTWPHHKIISALKKLKPPESGWAACRSRRMSKCDTYSQAPRRQERCQYTFHCESVENDSDEVSESGGNNKEMSQSSRTTHGRSACARAPPAVGPPSVQALPCDPPSFGSQDHTSHRPGRTIPLPSPPRDHLTEPASPVPGDQTDCLQLRKTPDQNISGARCESPTDDPDEQFVGLPPQTMGGARTSTPELYTPGGPVRLNAIEDYIVRHLAQSKQHNTEVLNGLKDIRQTQVYILYRITQLEEKQNKSCRENLTADDLDIPLRTIEDFAEVEKLLEGKPQRQTLRKYLAVFCGATLDAAARAIVSRVMIPALQLQFNMNGKKGTKVALKGTNLCSVIIGAIMQHIQDTNEHAVEQAVGKFLSRAGDRDGGRQKRRPLHCLAEENMQP